MGHNKINNYTDFYYIFFRNVLLVGIPLVVISALILGFGVSHSSAGDNSTVDQLSITIPSSCTLTATVNSAHSASLVAGTYTTNIGTTTIKTHCNDNNGFSIYAIGAGNDVEGNTNLVSSIGGDYDIPTGLNTSAPPSGSSDRDISNWSMKITSLAGAYQPTVVGGYDNYSLVPNTFTNLAYYPATTDIPNNNNSTIGSSITTTYAIYLATGQPAGTYTGKVKYAIMHPHTKTDVVTLAKAYQNAHKQKVQATDPVTGQSGEFYTMQDMSSAICDAANVMGEASQMEAVDIRDNKLYWITKMADGKCWMTENLDLDLISDPQAENYVALTSENTNLTLYGSNGYDNTVVSGVSNGYSCNNDSPICENGVITWLPERTTIPPSDLNSTTWKGDNSNPYSYDKGNYEPDGYKDGHGKSGNYYNWTAAIASNNSSSYTGGVAANSICPKGWRLPNTEAYEFSKLLYAYGVTKDDKNGSGYATGGYNKMIANPLYFVKTGAVDDGSLNYLSTYGYYESSSISSTSKNHLLFFTNSVYIVPNYNYGKDKGLSIRCISE